MGRIVLGRVWGELSVIRGNESTDYPIHSSLWRERDKFEGFNRGEICTFYSQFCIFRRGDALGLIVNGPRINSISSTRDKFVACR